MQGKKPKKTRKKCFFPEKKTRNEKNGFFHNPRHHQSREERNSKPLSFLKSYHSVCDSLEMVPGQKKKGHINEKVCNNKTMTMSQSPCT